jgi:hypothetical protein
MLKILRFDKLEGLRGERPIKHRERKWQSTIYLMKKGAITL